MSLLQEHANQLGNHITNNEELTNVAASQKAQSLADKYNEVMEHYNAGVGAVSTLSSAIHMGRKVYKGLQKARAGTSVEAPSNSTAQATANDVPARGAEAVDPAARPEGAPKPKKMNVPTDVEDTRATSAATFQERAPETGARPAQATHPTGTQSEAPAGENDSSPMTDADRLGAPRAGEPITNRAPWSRAQTATEGAEDLGGDLTENIGSQVAKKGVGDAIKGAVSGIGSEGLEAGAMTALDAVPVVGELAAVGMGLYSLFHGLADKPPDAEEEKAKLNVGAEGAAIDPSALLGKAN